MERILVFAGTTEGRKIALYLVKNGLDCTVSVATAYGRNIMDLEEENLKILKGPLNQEAILGKVDDFDLIIDSTHPYAKEVSENIKFACSKKNKDYVSLVREEVDINGCVEVEDMAEAINYFNRRKGSILVTTGSKELHLVKTLENYQERCYVRVLPILYSLQKATELGFRGSHIIAMEGPFSIELNKVLLKETGVQYLLTKESGITGGLEEKIKAAKDLGVTVVLIKRPNGAKGYNYESMKDFFKKRYRIEASHERKAPYFPLFLSLEKKNIVVVGAGKIAERRIRKLLSFKGNLLVIAPEATDGIKEMNAIGKIKWIDKYYEKTNLENSFLVLALTDNREVNKEIGLTCKENNIFVSVGDCKEESNFYFPGTLIEDDLVLGMISAKGNNHSLVKEKLALLEGFLGVDNEKNSNR